MKKQKTFTRCGNIYSPIRGSGSWEKNKMKPLKLKEHLQVNEFGELRIVKTRNKTK